jgi:hypothetical protein
MLRPCFLEEIARKNGAMKQLSYISAVTRRAKLGPDENGGVAGSTNTFVCSACPAGSYSYASGDKLLQNHNDYFGPSLHLVTISTQSKSL